MKTLINWTPEEDQKLLQAKQTMTAREIVVNIFPYRTLGSVNMRVAILKRQADPTYYTDVNRSCTRCGSLVAHANRMERDRSVKKNLPCKRCIAERQRTTMLGEGNPFYGKKHSEATKEIISHVHAGRKLTEEHKAKCIPHLLANRPPTIRDYLTYWIGKLGEEKGRARFEEYQRLQSENTKGANNPMYGKPSPQGSGNGWKGWYKGWHFHSLREIQYYLQAEADGHNLVKIHAIKEYRLPYLDYNGEQRTYTPDFLLDGHTIIEVKPKNLWTTQENSAKFAAAEAFYKAKGLTFRVVDIQPDSLSLKAKYLTGEITFTNRYENRFRRHIGLPQNPDLPLAKIVNNRGKKRTRVADIPERKSQSW